MCGLFGYIGPRNPLQRCLDGLEQLEYRGYDSTGIGGIAQGALLFCKRAGKLSHLKQVLNLPPLDLAIAHTRWATHGAVTDQNAHPHLDTKNTFALIHNGIIENYAELKEMLRREGVHFSSETIQKSSSISSLNTIREISSTHCIKHSPCSKGCLLF